MSRLLLVFHRAYGVNYSVFEGSSVVYPQRKVTHEDNGDVKMGS